MAIQLPSRKAPQGRRKYAQPITRRNIQRVQGRPDPGAKGGPNAAATPLAFGGGKGLIEAGTQLQQLGEKWRLAEIQRQKQRNALLLERVTDLMKDGFNKIVAKQQPTRIAQQNKGGVPPFGVKQTPSPSSTGGGGFPGKLDATGSIPAEIMQKDWPTQ